MILCMRPYIFLLVVMNKKREDIKQLGARPLRARGNAVNTDVLKKISQLSQRWPEATQKTSVLNSTFEIPLS